jgi:hypothetical protein
LYMYLKRGCRCYKSDCFIENPFVPNRALNLFQKKTSPPLLTDTGTLATIKELGRNMHVDPAKKQVCTASARLAPEKCLHASLLRWQMGYLFLISLLVTGTQCQSLVRACGRYKISAVSCDVTSFFFCESTSYI